MEYTVKEFAQLEGVETRTVWRWVAKGAVDFRRTPGGRLRIIDRRHNSRVSVFAQTYSDEPGQSAK